MFNRHRKNSFTINLASLSPAELALGAGEMVLASQTGASMIARRVGHKFITELTRRLNGSSSNGLHDVRFDDLDTEDLITARVLFLVFVEGNERPALKTIFTQILAHLANDAQRSAAAS